MPFKSRLAIHLRDDLLPGILKLAAGANRVQEPQIIESVHIARLAAVYACADLDAKEMIEGWCWSIASRPTQPRHGNRSLGSSARDKHHDKADLDESISLGHRRKLGHRVWRAILLTIDNRKAWTALMRRTIVYFALNVPSDAPLYPIHEKYLDELVVPGMNVLRQHGSARSQPSDKPESEGSISAASNAFQPLLAVLNRIPRIREHIDGQYMRILPRFLGEFTRSSVRCLFGDAQGSSPCRVFSNRARIMCVKELVRTLELRPLPAPNDADELPLSDAFAILHIISALSIMVISLAKRRNEHLSVLAALLPLLRNFRYRSSDVHVRIASVKVTQMILENLHSTINSTETDNYCSTSPSRDVLSGFLGLLRVKASHDILDPTLAPASCSDIERNIDLLQELQCALSSTAIREVWAVIKDECWDRLEVPADKQNTADPLVVQPETKLKGISAWSPLKTNDSLGWCDTAHRSAKRVIHRPSPLAEKPSNEPSWHSTKTRSDGAIKQKCSSRKHDGRRLAPTDSAVPVTHISKEPSLPHQSVPSRSKAMAKEPSTPVRNLADVYLRSRLAAIPALKEIDMTDVPAASSIVGGLLLVNGVLKRRVYKSAPSKPMSTQETKLSEVETPKLERPLRMDDLVTPTGHRGPPTPQLTQSWYRMASAKINDQDDPLFESSMEWEPSQATTPTFSSGPHVRINRSLVNTLRTMQ